MPISRKNRLDIGITMFIYRTAPLLRPHPPFATYMYFQEKEGGGRGVTTRTCAFASQLKALGQYIRAKLFDCQVANVKLRPPCGRCLVAVCRHRSHVSAMVQGGMYERRGWL